MDPAKKRRRQPLPRSPSAEKTAESIKAAQFGEETEEDKSKTLADAEQKNLWDATEVIDMDTF
jgi:hypothetical protein